MPTMTAVENNAGDTLISDGRTAWGLGLDYDTTNLGADLAAWASGEWEPSENDGQVPVPLAEYAEVYDATDSHPLSTATGRRYGRPPVGPQVIVRMSEAMRADCDRAAEAAGLTRAEWLRRVIEGALS